jgi:hypothetical protein
MWDIILGIIVSDSAKVKLKYRYWYRTKCHQGASYRYVVDCGWIYFHDSMAR